MESGNIWESVKNNVKQKNIANKLLQTWFEPTTLVRVEDTDFGSKRFVLGVPHDMHKFWLSQNLIDGICEEISSLYKQPFEVQLTVVSSDRLDQPEDLKYGITKNLETAAANTNNEPSFQRTAPSSFSKKDVLNPEYTFNNFVVGRNNEFAHATAHKVADSYAKGAEKINPLFLCGPTGMGKTHLLHAIGNYMRSNYPQMKICYISAERFLNEFISGIRHKEMHKFQSKFRYEYDVLLMDDIQVLNKGEGIQEEFFNTLNAFIETGRQVAVASDRMPRDIPSLHERIRTRLEWGVITDIQMPDLETRMAILRYKAEKKGVRLPEDVVQYIAKISKRSVREIEGNLNTLKMFSELQGLPINMEVAKKVLSSHTFEASFLTVDEVQKMVAEHFKLRVIDLKSANRSKPFVSARQAAMYLIKKHLNKSLQDIGRSFGGKDHTTVMHAIKKIENQLDKDSDLRSNIDDLEAKIHNITGV